MSAASADAAASGQGAKALDGIRVVELANLIAGPSIGMMLADYGAEVVKIEQPDGGDGIRTWGGHKNGVGLFHKALNRNKRCITADVRTPIGRRVLGRLLERADVLIESFRPGTLEKWQLGPEQLHAVHPALVILRVSGFGQSGPYRERSGFGSLAEAMTGFAYTNGFPDRAPLLPGIALADSTTGLAGAFLALAAIQARANNGGRGQVVDLPIYEALLSLSGAQLIEYDQLGLVPERTGGRLTMVSPRNTFRTRDGKWIAVSAGTATVFERLCAALDLASLPADPRFADNQARRVHSDELEALLQEAIGRFDQDELARRIAAHDAPAAPVYSVVELMRDPHFEARGNVASVRDDELDCDVRMQNVVGRLSATPGAIEHAGRPLGADNRTVLVDELGFTEQELREGGIAV